MAIERIIPTRPSNDGDFDIKKNDKELLTYVVALGVPNEAAFGRFYPEFLTSDGRLNKEGKGACRQFFNYGRNRDYMDAYRATLKAAVSEPGAGATPGLDSLDGERKDRALAMLLDAALRTVEGGGTLDPDTLKVITELFKKLGLLKDQDVEEEAPRRYLPVTCRMCRYRSFAEEGIESGAVEDECLRCRAMRHALDNGFIYDPTRLLETENINPKQ